MSASHLMARLKKLDILSNRLLESLLAGNYSSVFKGPGLEFSQVREYSEGDDPRQIDWNVSSRMGSTFTKTFKEERELVLFLIVDLSASVFTARGSSQIREAANTIFSLLALAATNNNDRVGACFFSDRIEQWVAPRKGRAHALRLIQDLHVAIPLGQGSDLAKALRSTGESLARRGICVVLSDFKTSGYMRELALLARKHDVIAVRLVPPEDLAFPRIGMVQMEEAETGDIIRAYGSSHVFRKAYRDYWLTQRKQWFRDCRRYNVSPLEIRSDEDPIQKLVQFFERRKVRH